jgi:hypothetical protein
MYVIILKIICCLLLLVVLLQWRYIKQLQNINVLQMQTIADLLHTCEGLKNTMLFIKDQIKKIL